MLSSSSVSDREWWPWWRCWPPWCSSSSPGSMSARSTCPWCHTCPGRHVTRHNSVGLIHTHAQELPDVFSRHRYNIMMNVKYPFIHFSFHAFESDFIKSTLVLPTKCDAHSFQMSAFEKFWILCAFPKKYTNLQFGRYPHADKIKAEWRSKLFPLTLSAATFQTPQ